MALSTTEFILWGAVLGLLLGIVFGLRQLIVLERRILKGKRKTVKRTRKTKK
ncbi:MAG: hypothetical protein VW079_00230 [Candidatus Woesearchaeota archaeon]|jgi:hypothetical protein